MFRAPYATFLCATLVKLGDRYNTTTVIRASYRITARNATTLDPRIYSTLEHTTLPRSRARNNSTL